MVLGLVLLSLTAPMALAQTGEVAPASADTIRTNIWLVESLMADIVAASTQVLPAPPARILLVPRSDSEENTMFGATAFRQLSARGYEIYDPAAEGEDEPEHDVRYGYAVSGVDLSYPDVGRTLGLWQTWIERDLEIDAYLQITESASGRVLLGRRVARSFSDRVPAGDFDAVNSDMYTFTTAETSESGWQRRTEEIVVLGALTGLILVYFANTTN
ncbi:hypothetical protein DRQ50_01800 [bacterium]|nr:MAG: hypothetical protein DRQ50_01800 [bacterium]